MNATSHRTSRTSRIARIAAGTTLALAAVVGSLGSAGTSPAAAAVNTSAAAATTTAAPAAAAKVVRSPALTGFATNINVAQTTAAGVANAVYYDMHTFWSNNFRAWGWSRYYTAPQVKFYSQPVYACGITMAVMNSYACQNGQIWFSLPFNQQKINAYGDYASGVILAHEFGHHIQNRVGWKSRTAVGNELFADCLAGMYTKYGYLSGKLTGGDLYEGQNGIRSLGSSTSHGTTAQRIEWFNYGYNINSCKRALS